MKKQIDRAVAWMGTSPNAWRVLAAVNGALAVLFLAMAIFVEQARWVTIVDAVLAGFNIGQAVNAWYISARRAFQDVHAAFNSMVEINNALVDDKFEAMILRSRPDDDEAPIAPTKLN